MPTINPILKIFTIFVMASFSLLAQTNNKLNSKQATINYKVNSYLEISADLLEKNPKQALEYSQKALDLCIKNNNLKLACLVLNHQGELFDFQKNYNDEKKTYLYGIEIANKLKDDNELFQFHLSLGLLEYNLGYYQNSIDSYLSALRIIENQTDKSFLPILLNNIGISYFKLSKYEEALKYYFKALSQNETKRNKLSTVRTLINIGTVYTEMRNFQKALSYFEQSLSETRGANLNNLESIIYNNIGNIYLGQNNFIKAIENHQKALNLRIKLNDRSSIASSYNNLGTSYEGLGRYNMADEFYQKALEQYKILNYMPGIATSLRNKGTISIKLGNLQNAEYFLKASLSIADSNKLQNIKADIYYSYAIFYSNQGKHKESDYYYNLHVNLTDSLNNAANREKVAQMEVLYQTEKKDRENRLLKLENEKQEASIERQRGLVLFLIIVLVLIIGLVVLFYKFYQNRKKSARILAEKNKLLTESEESLRLMNATKDRFFSIISHDLRNPFAALSVTVDNIKNYHSTKNYDRMDNVIKSLDRSVKGTKNLLSNLLEWSMTQTGKIKFEPKTFKLSALINSSKPLWETQAALKSQKIHFALDDSITVYSDEYMIDTVIRNLVTNAIKFTPRTGNISIVTVRKNGFAEVSVIDSGIGIPANKIDNLFKIETQVKSRGTDNEAGTGLGLILCKEFIEKNNGTIFATSEEGKGSKFTITLPISNIKEN